MREISMLLCVVLLSQCMTMPVLASEPFGAPAYAGAAAGSISQNAYEQAAVSGNLPQPGQLLHEEMEPDEERADGTGEETEVVLPELRYDFCEIEDSAVLDRQIGKEALASAYLSPEAASVSGNDSSYAPNIDLPQLLSPVRNQNPTNTCWAFATTGAMELSAIKDGIRTAEQSYSPYHMAYFLYHHVADPLGGTSEDVNTAVSSEPAFLSAGGNLFMALFQAANWIGPADESVAPFDTYKETGEALPDSLSYETDGVLKNGYMLSTGENMTMEIKQAVVSYGGVAVMYNGDGKYRNAATSASYCDQAGTNHAVVIVGWNDDYAVENFLSSFRPSSPGAWIVKNSWGSGSGIGGYYYLSYEDQSIAFPTAVEMMESGTYENNYHYDGSLAASAASTVSLNSGGSLANIFTAHASEEHYDERLEAVSIAIQSTDVSYDLMIYRKLESDSDGKLNPDSGTLAHKQSGVLGMAGIYTIPLTTPVVLESGETFSVVFRLSRQDGSVVYVWTEKDYNYGWCNGSANIRKGQSFRKYASNYSWFDLYYTNKTTNQFRNLARIKAFTNTLDTIGSYNISNYACSVSENSYVADGTDKCPAVTVTRAGVRLVQGQDYEVAYENNSETGTASAVVTGIAPYYGTVTLPFQIYAYSQEMCPGHFFEESQCIHCGFTLKEQELALDADEDMVMTAGAGEEDYRIQKTFLDDPFMIRVSGNQGEVTYHSDDTQVLQVDRDGTVTICKAGTAHITVEAAQTEQFAGAKKVITVVIARAKLARAVLSQTSYEYDRTAKLPDVTVYDQKGNVLSQYRDYALSYTGNLNPGTAEVEIIGTGSYTGELTEEFVILRRAQDACTHVYEKGSCIYCGYTRQIQLLKGTKAYEKKYSAGGFLLDLYTTGDGGLSYVSDDPEVATVDEKGYVTICGTGSCYVTVTAAETNRYYLNSAQVLIEVIQGNATITVPETTVTKTYGAKAFSLGAKTNSDGVLTYKSGNKKIASVSAKGKVTIKGYGKVTLTVTSAETEKYAAKTKKVTLKVVPKKAGIKKLKANGGGKLTVSVKKDKTVSGYQVQLATDSGFRKNRKTTTLTKASSVRAVFTKLKKGKTYYVRIRSYKKAGGVKYYGAYSAVKKVKVK
ncbi:MAG: hypothetical protein IJ711_07875 [Lachnospiraceae bacterium]|nr:hypothetical protein [Lachnospiraceae bacterium]